MPPPIKMPYPQQQDKLSGGDTDIIDAKTTKSMSMYIIIYQDVQDDLGDEAQ